MWTGSSLTKKSERDFEADTSRTGHSTQSGEPTPAAGHTNAPGLVAEWLKTNTFVSGDYDRHELAARKGSQLISVVLPARNEAKTVGVLVEAFRRELIEECALIDELIVIDSGSTDETFSVASAAGATVHRQSELLPGAGDRRGKGEALWKSLSAVSGDIVVFCDADLRQADPQLVVGLVGPLLVNESLKFVKACYDRALDDGATIHPAGGGRVTELVARPLLNMWWPDLSGFIQPLAGEYAARRDVFSRIPFAGRYGVEIAMLVDIYQSCGLAAMAQVDSGVRKHRNSADAVLGVMAAELQSVVLAKLQEHGRLFTHVEVSSELRQFKRVGDRFVATMTDITLVGRPPMVDVLGTTQGERNLDAPPQ